MTVSKGLVVFDLFGTLVRSSDLPSPARLADALVDRLQIDSDVARGVSTRVFTAIATEAVDRDVLQTPTSEILVGALSFANLAATAEQLDAVMLAAFGGTWDLAPDAAAVVGTLHRQGHAIHVLSNGLLTSRLTLQLLHDAGLTGIAGVSSSGDGGPKKPQLAAFAAVGGAQRYAFRLMIGDDAELDIAPAVASGWATIHIADDATLAAVPERVLRLAAASGGRIPLPAQLDRWSTVKSILEAGFSPLWPILSEYARTNWPYLGFVLSTEDGPPIEATLHVGDDGNSVSEGIDPRATVYVRAAVDDFLKIHTGEVDPLQAFGAGLLRLDGDEVLRALLPVAQTGTTSTGPQAADVVWDWLIGAADSLPRTVAELESGILADHFAAFQLFIALGDSVVAEAAAVHGGAVELLGGPSTSRMHRLLCAGKPFTALCIALLCQEGIVGLDEPVAKHLPVFDRDDKRQVTVRHLLTHTAGLASRVLADDATHASLADVCGVISETPLREGWVPGLRCAYDMENAWYVLGAVVEACSGTDLESYFQCRLLPAAAISGSQLTFADPGRGGSGEGTEPLVQRTPDGRYALFDTAPTALARSTANPGTGTYGTAGDLGRLYAGLLGCLEQARAGQLSPLTLSAFTATQRTGVIDETVKTETSYGLGFQTALGRYSSSTSPRAFGHSGDEGGIRAYCDPESGLVVTLRFNGAFVGRRSPWRTICDSIARDLRLPSRP